MVRRRAMEFMRRGVPSIATTSQKSRRSGGDHWELSRRQDL
jgi:hypothetical protein